MATSEQLRAVLQLYQDLAVGTMSMEQGVKRMQEIAAQQGAGLEAPAATPPPSGEPAGQR